MHRVSRLTTYSLIYTYIHIIESFLPLIQPLIVTEIYPRSPGEREKRKERKREPSSQQSSSILENLQAIRFYRFIHQRGNGIYYKNRIIVDIEAQRGWAGVQMWLRPPISGLTPIIHPPNTHTLNPGDGEPSCVPP